MDVITRSDHFSNSNSPSSNGGALLHPDWARVLRAGGAILVLLIFTLQVVYRVMGFFVVTSRICYFFHLSLRLGCKVTLMCVIYSLLSLVTLACITFFLLFVLILLLILQRVATTMGSLNVIASIIKLRGIVLQWRLIYSLLRHRHGVQNMLDPHFQVFLSIGWHEILLSPRFELYFRNYALLLAHFLVLQVELMEANSIKSLLFSLTCESLW